MTRKLFITLTSLAALLLSSVALAGTGFSDAPSDAANGGGEITGASVVEFLTVREDNPSSIVNCISAARENARTVRDQISNEMWECLTSRRKPASSLPR